MPNKPPLLEGKERTDAAIFALRTALKDFVRVGREVKAGKRGGETMGELSSATDRAEFVLLATEEWQ